MSTSLQASEFVTAYPAVLWTNFELMRANYWLCGLVVDNLLQRCRLPVIHRPECGNWWYKHTEESLYTRQILMLDATFFFF